MTEFLGRAKHQRRGVDMQGYRNGYGKPRRLTMRSGDGNGAPAAGQRLG